MDGLGVLEGKFQSGWLPQARGGRVVGMNYSMHISEADVNRNARRARFERRKAKHPKDRKPGKPQVEAQAEVPVEVQPVEYATAG